MQSLQLAENIAEAELTEENSKTLKQNYEELMIQLSIDGIPKNKISSIGKQIIIERKKQKLFSKGIEPEEITVGSWWYDVARTNGFTDQKFSPVEVTEPEPENSSKKKTKAPNIRFIDYLKRTKSICDIAIKKLSESDNIEDILSKNELEILVHEWDAVLNIAENSFNEKTKVPINTQNLILLEAATASSITNAGKTFQEIKLNQYEELGKYLTAKQIGKIQERTVPELLPLFKPDSRDAAIFMGFFGLSCPHCYSWRVLEQHDVTVSITQLHCLDCEKKFQGKTVSKCRKCQIPFYKEELLQVVKKGKCPNPSCQHEMELPAELVIYAQS